MRLPTSMPARGTPHPESPKGLRVDVIVTLTLPAMRMVNGRFPLIDKPGLGFDLIEDALKKYPFAGTRPMPRVFHSDGSVAEW